MTRKTWADRGSRQSRGYGAAWDRIRPQIMKRDNHLCQPCKRKGRATPAREVDHIIPKALGGDDHPDNLEAICTPCHKVKTKIETGSKPRREIGTDGWPATDELEQFGFSIPHGVQRSAIPVTLVCGPPASGKSTYAQQHAAPDDTVIDFDLYLAQVGAPKWTADKDAVRQAFLIRDAHIRSLEAKTTGQAWLIVTAPSKAERQAWRNALGDVRVVVLDVAVEVCMARLRQDADRQHALRQMEQGIKDWWRRYQPDGRPAAP